MRQPLMRCFTLLAILALCAGVAVADCGKKDTHEGTLTSADADSNTIVVTVGEEQVQLTLTANTKVMDAKGKAAEVGNLVGKKVKVVSEHAKIDSIEQIA